MALLDEKQARLRQQINEITSRGTNADATVQGTDGFAVPDLEVPADAPPAYGAERDRIQFSQPGFEAGAAVTSDGRVNININTKNSRLAELLGPAIARQFAHSPLPPAYIPPSQGDAPGQKPPPPLNIVIQIVGSRGDVQPFVALGKVLREKYGHRVRIATHATFQKFVEENDLEFFCIGGDPAELMAFMVKHPGLMPGLDALKSGEITKRRKGIQDILMGCWRSCIEAGDGLGPPPQPHAKHEPWDPSAGLAWDVDREPFVADAIIANPPSFAHIHVAEKLGIPLHMMFTMPWSPTRAFPHPLANIQSSNCDDVLTNYLTYTLVEMMTWQGLGDIINRFREKALDLPTMSLIWAPGLLSRLKISYTYCWSPALIPKPNDWGPHIDIAGFYFLNLASSYNPEPALKTFLDSGPPPVYIGFGSIVVDDPNAMTRMIFDAVRLAGVRALVSKGWGGLGADDVGLPDGVFMLGNVPHDWLFERVSCVVHHGGAGTTAAGIKAGKPTIVVPFFGDQPFWGAMIAKAKAGPSPIHSKQLTAEKLAEAIKFCLLPNTQNQATALGQRIREENGTEAGSSSFHRHLDLEALRCSVAPSRAAAWRVRRSKVRLSPLAAAVLVDKGLLEYKDLKLYRPCEYNTEDQPPDPITAGASSLVADISGIGMAFADMPREIFKTHQRRKESHSSSKDGTGADKGKGTGCDKSSEGTPAHEAEASDQNNSDTETALVTVTSVPTSSTSTDCHRTASSSRMEALHTEAALDATIGVGRGVGRVVATGVKSPMNFCLGLAKGFRNIPKLYNDDTIRSVDKVTDLSSGVKVATKELGFGLYDGIAGLVTQPMKGAQKEGVGGFMKGVGKGLGGLIAKPAAGFWGVPAYMMQGAYAEVNKYFSRSVSNYIVTSRVVQGQRDFSGASDGEKRDIVQRWHDDLGIGLDQYYAWKRKEIAAAKAPVASGGSSAQTHSRTSWYDNKRNISVESDHRRYLRPDSPATESSGSNTPTTLSINDSAYEEAIQNSVRETSTGNREEDARIETAVRETVMAARRQGALPPPGSLAADAKAIDVFEDEQYKITDEEYQDLIEQAIKESLAGQANEPSYAEQEGFPSLYTPSSSRLAVLHGEDTNHPQHDGVHDPDLQRAIQESQRNQQLPPPPALPSRQTLHDYEHGHEHEHDEHEQEDEDLRRAIEASKHDIDRHQSERAEEDIVLAYVKKQSLAEEELRRQHLARKEKENQGGHEHGDEGGDGDGDGGRDEDDDLRRAIAESLRLHPGEN